MIRVQLIWPDEKWDPVGSVSSTALNPGHAQEGRCWLCVGSCFCWFTLKVEPTESAVGSRLCPAVVTPDIWKVTLRLCLNPCGSIL